MSKTTKLILGLVGGVIIFVLLVGSWFTGTYNTLVAMRENIESQWSNVEVQYQRRADLVPQLVATVSGAADFEQDTLTAVTEARTQWLNSQAANGGDRESEIAAANNLDSAIARLLVTVESYPTLTATAGFQGLQAQLEGTENRVAVERRKYKLTVTPYNSKIQQFPSVIVANIGGFAASEFFEAQAGSENAPEVNFDN